MNPTKVRRVLWLDCGGGLAVGNAMFALSDWGREFFGMSAGLYFGIATANLLYGLFALSLALRSHRPRGLLTALAVANATWGVLCLGALPFLFGQVSIFGAGHVLAEGLFVLWLARVEWEHRDLLVHRDASVETRT